MKNVRHVKNQKTNVFNVQIIEMKMLILLLVNVKKVIIVTEDIVENVHHNVLPVLHLINVQLVLIL